MTTLFHDPLINDTIFAIIKKVATFNLEWVWEAKQ